MNQDPQLRSRNTATKLIVAATAGVAAVALAFSQTESNYASNCDTRITDPLSWVICPIVDAGSSVKSAVFDELSFQMNETP